MLHALLLNAGILITVVLCLVLLQNPLALFGLLLLKDLPYGLLVNSEKDEGDEKETPRSIGFID